TKRAHSLSLTRTPPPMWRPNISSTTCDAFWAPRHSKGWAKESLMRARASAGMAAAEARSLIALLETCLLRAQNRVPRPCVPDAVQRVASAERCTADPGSPVIFCHALRPGLQRATPCCAARGEVPPLPAQALDGGAAAGELVFQPFEAAIEVIDAVDHGLAFRGKRGDHERHGGPQVRRHHRRTFESLHALHTRAFPVEPDASAEPHQLLHVHETILENGLRDARGAARPGHQRHQLRLQVGGEAGERRPFSRIVSCTCKSWCG